MMDTTPMFPMYVTYKYWNMYLYENINKVQYIMLPFR